MKDAPCDRNAMARVLHTATADVLLADTRHGEGLMQRVEMTLEQLRDMAEEIANALHSVAEDRSSPASYGCRVARGHALALVDLP